MPGRDHDSVVPNDELTDEDRSAMGWAVSIGHELGAEIVERVRRGGVGVRADELAVLRASWDAAGRPAPGRHEHRTRVELVDGTTITGVTFQADDPNSRDVTPAFGVYLDDHWSPPWTHVQVDWPDFGTPADPDALRAALEDALGRAREANASRLAASGVTDEQEPPWPASPCLQDHPRQKRSPG